MPRTVRAEIKSSDIIGLKHFARLGGLRKKRHSVGCERDRDDDHSKFTCETPINDISHTGFT